MLRYFAAKLNKFYPRYLKIQIIEVLCDTVYISNDNRILRMQYAL